MNNDDYPEYNPEYKNLYELYDQIMALSDRALKRCDKIDEYCGRIRKINIPPVMVDATTQTDTVDDDFQLITTDDAYMCI